MKKINDRYDFMLGEYVTRMQAKTDALAPQLIDQHPDVTKVEVTLHVMLETPIQHEGRETTELVIEQTRIGSDETIVVTGLGYWLNRKGERQHPKRPHRHLLPKDLLGVLDPAIKEWLS